MSAAEVATSKHAEHHRHLADDIDETLDAAREVAEAALRAAGYDPTPRRRAMTVIFDAIYYTVWGAGYEAGNGAGFRTAEQLFERHRDDLVEHRARKVLGGVEDYLRGRPTLMEGDEVDGVMRGLYMEAHVPVPARLERTPVDPDYDPELDAYLNALRRALDLGHREVVAAFEAARARGVCPECGKTVKGVDEVDEDEEFWHALIDGVVVVGCQRFWVINPNLLGITDTDWQG